MSAYEELVNIGLAQGRQKGREEGRQEGALYGKIQAFQQVLNLPVSSTVELTEMTQRQRDRLCKTLAAKVARLTQRA